jgi:hypothetical protein
MVTGTRAAKIVARERYGWPGGYALALVMGDGETLCPDCVRECWREIVQANLWRDNGGDPCWTPAGITHTGETDDALTCAQCENAIA